MPHKRLFVAFRLALEAGWKQILRADRAKCKTGFRKPEGFCRARHLTRGGISPGRDGKGMILQRSLSKHICLCSLALLCGQSLAAAGPLPDGTLDLDDYRGKVVLVHFWASWSAPCRRSFPWLAAMHDRYADQGLVIILVNEDEAASAARAFLDEFPVSFTRIRDADGELFEAWDIVAMPSSYVIDRGGRIVARYLGFKPAQLAEFEATLRKTLARE